MTIKAGTAGVTADMVSDRYTTPVLGVGGVKALTVVFKLVSASCSPSDPWTHVTFEAHPAASLTSFAR